MKLMALDKYTATKTRQNLISK